MKVEFNRELIHKISELEQLYVSLISWRLIFFDEESKIDPQMRDWVYEHFNEDVQPYIDMVNEKYKEIGFPPYEYKYL